MNNLLVLIFVYINCLFATLYNDTNIKFSKNDLGKVLLYKHTIIKRQSPKLSCTDAVGWIYHGFVSIWKSSNEDNKSNAISCLSALHGLATNKCYEDYMIARSDNCWCGMHWGKWVNPRTTADKMIPGIQKAIGKSAYFVRRDIEGQIKEDLYKVGLTIDCGGNEHTVRATIDLWRKKEYSSGYDELSKEDFRTSTDDDEL